MNGEPSRGRNRRVWGLALGAVFVLEAAHLIWWLQLDRLPPAWDEARHLQIGWDYLRALRAGDWEQLVKAPIPRGNPPYPPLYHLSLVPALALKSEDLAALMNWVYLLLLGGGAWSIVRRLGGTPFRAFAGATLCSILPPIMNLAHKQMTEVALIAWTVCTYAALLASDRFGNWKGSILFALCFSFGLLTKWTFPTYVLPACLVWGLAIRRHPAKAVAVALIVLVLTGPWYLANLVPLLIRLPREAKVGIIEGDPPVASLASLLWYPQNLLEQRGGVFLILDSIGLGFFLASRRKGKAVLLGWLLVGSLVWGLVRNKDGRYILPVLVVAPLLSGVGLPRPLLGLELLGAAAAFLPHPPLGPLLDRPSPDRWPHAEIVSEIHRRIPSTAAMTSITLVANHPFLNSTDLTWALRKEGIENVYLRWPDHALGQFADFVLFKTGDFGPVHAANKHVREAVEDVLNSGSWFHAYFGSVAEWTLPDGSTAVLFAPRPDPPTGRPSWHGEETAFGKAVLRDSSAEWKNRTLRLEGSSASVNGLEIEKPVLELEGLSVAAARDGWRPLGLDSLSILGGRVRQESLEEVLRQRARWVREPTVRMEEGRVEVKGIIGSFPAMVGARVWLSEDRRFLQVSVERVSWGGFSTPRWALARWGHKRFELFPHPGAPFWIRLNGVKVGGGELAVY